MKAIDLIFNLPEAEIMLVYLHNDEGDDDEPTYIRTNCFFIIEVQP